MTPTCWIGLIMKEEGRKKERERERERKKYKRNKAGKSFKNLFRKLGRKFNGKEES